MLVFPSAAHDLAKTEERSKRAGDKGEEQKENLPKFNLRALDEFRYVISLVGKIMKLHAMLCDVWMHMSRFKVVLL